MEESNKQEKTKPCTIQGFRRILFIVACACVWAVSYQLIQMLPTFWHVGTPMLIGWLSHLVYREMFP